MSFAPSFAADSRDSLALRAGAVVRSAPMTKAPDNTLAKLQRAKGRLYVFGQLAGWGMFLLMQVLFLSLFTSETLKRDRVSALAGIGLVVCSGLLLTHYARGPMSRWGWKELGWRALTPRIASMALLLSFLWSAFGYGWTYLVIGEPWPTKIPPLGLFAISVFNGAVMMLAWLCAYFFYHIFDRLQRMQVEQLRLAASAKEAELRALKSQVNPHFLFNSLNSLRALIDEDAPRARESVTRLANMLRYSLQSGQLETVPFEDELRIVEDYLALEQIRHENRLRVRWEIAAEVRPRGLPPMLLQTLVENAVKYGISQRRDGGEIVVSAQLRAGQMIIRVTNPGDLSPPAARSAAAKAGSSTGVGLRNASERLNLLFGEKARLELRPEQPGTVTAEVVIPLASTP
ncbi:MAG: histidine kinase [Opitutus sp.]|nr:histidine kinase [Opitutus sp.]